MDEKFAKNFNKANGAKAAAAQLNNSSNSSASAQVSSYNAPPQPPLSQAPAYGQPGGYGVAP